jgi:hypothetical protein
MAPSMLPRSRRRSPTRLRAVFAAILEPLAPMGRRLPPPRAAAPPASAALLLAGAALLFAGCGAGTAARVEGHRVNLTLDEYRILPRIVSVPAGPTVIVVRNRGILVHNVALEREGLSASGKPTILTITPPLLPGGRVSLVTSPLAPGRYVLASTIGNEAVLGMSGTLIVR